MAIAAFIIAGVGVLAGIVMLEADLAAKAFLAMSYLFSLTATITLSKVSRDNHEARKIINKVETAKTERFLNESSL